MLTSTLVRRGRALASAALAVAAFGTAVCAQDKPEEYPSRNIVMLVPYPPGGAPDIIIRVIGRKMSDALGKPIIIENRPGASTTVASVAAARSEPNGYTLLATDVALSVVPSTIANLKFDPVKDLKPVSLTARGEFTVAVNTELPVKSLAELVAYSKQNPEAIKGGHPGVGTPPHLFSLVLIEATGMKALLVPYRGVALAVTDVVAGHIQMLTSVPGVTANLARDGKLRVLAVGGSRRMASLPDVPTLAELGVKPKGFDRGNWFGISAPAGTPDPVIAKLNAAVRSAVVDPEAIASLEKIDLVLGASTPAEYGELVASQVATWREVLISAGIKPE